LKEKKSAFSFNEKQLRDEAAAEVATQISMPMEDGSSRKRKHLNADERLQLSRDRNREHAKNTRLRKKAYVTKLKDTVDLMVRQKNIEEAERIALGIRIFETQQMRKNTVRLYLSYRAVNMRERDKWANILDDSFQLILPITPYRSFPKGTIINSSRVVIGIDAAMADTASLALMAQGIGMSSPLWQESIKSGQACRLAYITSQDEMVAANEHVMCPFTLRTEGFEQVGATQGCVQHGMLQARFNLQNKLVAVEMMFDVMGFMQQLQVRSIA